MPLIDPEKFDIMVEGFKEMGFSSIPILRTFMVDFRDDQNNCYNETSQIICPPLVDLPPSAITKRMEDVYEPRAISYMPYMNY